MPGVSFSDYLTIKEGTTHLVTIESSLPDNQNASVTVQLITLHKYRLLVGDDSADNPYQCKENNVSSGKSKVYFIEKLLSFVNLHPAEGIYRKL